MEKQYKNMVTGFTGGIHYNLKEDDRVKLEIKIFQIYNKLIKLHFDANADFYYSITIDGEMIFLGDDYEEINEKLDELKNELRLKKLNRIIED